MGREGREAALQLGTPACVLSCFSLSPLCAAPRTVAHRPLCLRNSPGRSTGGGCHFLLQGICQAQGSNPGLSRLLHWQAGSLLLVPPGDLEVGAEEGHCRWRGGAGRREHAQTSLRSFCLLDCRRVSASSETHPRPGKSP